MMGLVMAVTVIGLKLVGLVLIVALLIIPAVTARFWTERTDAVVAIAGALGGVSGYVGAALSASAPQLPTGPIIVLVAFGLFVLSLLFAPIPRAVAAAAWRHRRFQLDVHRRQGLLALAPRRADLRSPHPQGAGLTTGLIPPRPASHRRRCGAGREGAARREALGGRPQAIHRDEAVSGRYDGLTAIESVLTRDEIAELDRRLGPPAAVEGAG